MTYFSPRLRKIRAVLFDWGNTLANVSMEKQIMADCARAAAAKLQAQGYPIKADAADSLHHAFQQASFQQNYSPPTYAEIHFPQLLREWLSMFYATSPYPEALLRNVLHAFWETWTNGLILLDNADWVLARLRRQGLATGLVSNVTAPAYYCFRQLERLGLRAQLDIFTFSSSVGCRKPNPRIYTDALEQLRLISGCETINFSEILFVGDWPVGDVLGPAQLGMATALIRHPRIPAYWPADDFHNLQPTCEIQYLHQLETILFTC